MLSVNVLCFFAGVVTACVGFFIHFYIQHIKTDLDFGYKRSCINCRHAIPAAAKDGKTRIFCSRCVDAGISTFPVEYINVCGHFAFTDEILDRQLRLSAERAYRNKKVGSSGKN